MPILTDVSLSEYHASPIPSHSKLRNLATRGPRFYYERHVTGTLKYDDDSDAKALGQAFETMLCAPRDFDRSFAMKPKDMKFSTIEGKAWRDAQLKAGKAIVGEEDLHVLRGMRDSLYAFAPAKELLEAATQQVTVRDGDQLQARPDFLMLEGTHTSGYRPFVVDLKTTKDLDDVTDRIAINRYGYHTQAACVRMTLAANGYPDAACFLLAIEKQYPYRARMVELHPRYVDIGEKWVNTQLAVLRRCQANNDWPVSDETILTVEPPPWLAA